MKNPINKLVVLAFMATCMIWCSCEDGHIVGVYDDVNSTNFVAKEPFSYNIEVNNQMQLRFEGINGNVDISGMSETNVISVTGEKRVGSESLNDARAHLSDLVVVVEDLPDEVFVKTSQPKDSRGRNYVVNYSIKVPQNMALLVDNINGKIMLNGIYASANVSQVNGNIEGEITLPLDGTVDMSTVNGNIELDLPKNSSAEFSARLINGNINVSNLVLQNPKSEAYRSLRGTLGDGRGTILVRTTNGNISVRGF